MQTTTLSKTGSTGHEIVPVCLHLDFDQLPAQYLGRVLADLGDLYSLITGEILIAEGVRPGSFKIWMTAAREYVKPFAEIFNSILRNRLSPENVQKAVTENLDSVISKLPLEHAQRIAKLENLDSQANLAEKKMNLEIVREYPLFIDRMVDLQSKFQPDVSPEAKMAAAVKAATVYETLFGIQSTFDVADFGHDHTSFVEMIRSSVHLEISEE
jgi:hypothetical protein